jgi:flagellar biosynthesis protein FliQ
VIKVTYNSSVVLESLGNLFYQSFLIMLPPLLLSLAVAIIIGIVMAAMQIQEQSLPFLPKLFAILLGFFLFGNMMFNNLVTTIQEFILKSLELL